MAKRVIELQGVTKLYGDVVGVQDINLTVDKGMVFGFLGPNGAGKSTTIHMLIDFIRPTQGKISVFGLDSQADGVEIRQRVGFLPGDMALDRGFTGWQQLEYYGNLRGGYDKKYVQELARRLECKLDRKFRTLSRGNKQKVGLIAALMHKPDLLILDEPTSGLDPLIQAEFNKIILEQKRAGVTTFISSHMLGEVQELCDHVAFIREGTVLAERNMRDLWADLPKEVSVTSDDSKLFAAMKKLQGFVVLSHEGKKLSGTFEGDLNLLVNILAKHKVTNLHMHEADLESVFMQYYEEKNA